MSFAIHAIKKPLAAVFAFAAAACATNAPRLKPDVKIPTVFADQSVEAASGETELVQYRKAYQAFWYNCVALMSEKLDAHCPTTCRGTPASVSGCANGGKDAAAGIRSSVATQGEQRTQQMLRSIASEMESKAHMAAYFGEHPMEEYSPGGDGR
jgi:hypothetical protein